MSALAAPRPAAVRVAIRAATPADIDTLLAIENACFTQDRVSRRSFQNLTRSPSIQIHLATMGREPAGYAMVNLRRNSTVARLYSIATLPSARGLGLGRRLMEACERGARTHGCDRLRLEVRTRNHSAIGLYETLGYQRIGRYENYYEDGAPALRFEKTLKP
jgi:[ribosomal protein S18]-alanine N-acetyltransferase